MSFIASRLRLPATLAAVLAMVAVLGVPAIVRADGPLTLHTTVSLGYRANDVIVDGSFAYVATDKGLTIFDLANPAVPVKRGSAVTANCAVSCTKGPVGKSQGLAKKGNFVYLAAAASGMQVINVSDPDAPVTIASAIAPTRGTIYDVAVHPTANAAYSASYNGEVYVWNIADPAHPVLTQTLGVLMWSGGVCDTCVQRMLAETNSGSAYVTGVSTTGNIVAAVDWGYGGLYLWDSTNPLQLSFLGTHRIKVSLYRAELDLARDRAFTLGAVTPNAGLINVPISPIISQPASPDPKDHATYCATFGNGPVPSPAGPAPQCSGADTCVDCGYAKMTTSTGAALAGDGGGVGYSTNGKYAFYVGGRGTGELAIVDVSKLDPNDVFGSPPKVASTPVGLMGLQLAEAAGIVAKNDFLYVAAGLLGLRVYEFPGLGSSAP